MKVLVVEDNKVLLDTIREELEKHFEVITFDNGEDAIRNIDKNMYDIVILDIMLLNMSGLAVLEKMRKSNINTPVIILTAKESLDDKVGAFKQGANDYITKPFYMEELVARLYAILRTNGSISDENIIKFNDLILNINTKEVRIKGEKVDFINKEFYILEYLLINKGVILLKEQIYDRVWGLDCSIPIEIVEVHISNLRKKLSKYNYNKYIKTKSGIGYILDDK